MCHVDPPQPHSVLPDVAAWAAFGATTLLLGKLVFFLYFALERGGGGGAHARLSGWAAAAAAGDTRWSTASSLTLPVKFCRGCLYARVA